ncbi:MAG: TolC family protein, partial [Oleiharenicola lentus]
MTTLPLLFVAASAQPETPAEVVPVPVAPAGEVLTLDQAIQMALAKNFSIKVSGYNASIAAAGVTEALGKFDPILSGSYTHAENRNPLLTFSAPNVRDETRDQTDSYEAGVSGLVPWGLTYKLGGTTTNYRGTFNGYADNWDSFAGVSATQPLLRDFGFGATLASIRIARTNRSISDWQFRQSVIDTVTQVIRTYHELNYANAFLRSALRSRELATGLLTENEKRYKIGSMSEYDVTFARSNVAETEETILLAQRQVLDTENFLKQLISDDRTTGLLSLRLVIETPAPAPIVVVDPAADFRIALD